MTLAAVAADLGQALDVERHAAAQVAFHDEVVVDALTDLCFFLIGEVFHAGVRIDAGHVKNLFCAGSADTINVGQANFNSLVLGQVNAGDTCHLIRSFLSKFLFRAQKGTRLTPAGGSRPSGADVLGLTGSDQPCLCLCFGFSQITMTLPLRLMTLHFSHMGLTLGLTFIVVNLLLASPGDAAARQIVRRHLNRDLVTGEDSDKVHPELSGDVRQDDVAVADINPERRVGQGFDDRALQFDYIVFCQGV